MVLPNSCPTKTIAIRRVSVGILGSLGKILGRRFSEWRRKSSSGGEGSQSRFCEPISGTRGSVINTLITDLLQASSLMANSDSPICARGGYGDNEYRLCNTPWVWNCQLKNLTGIYASIGFLRPRVQLALKTRIYRLQNRSQGHSEIAFSGSNRCRTPVL